MALVTVIMKQSLHDVSSYIEKYICNGFKERVWFKSDNSSNRPDYWSVTQQFIADS